jgi:hypothetical protein
LSIEKSEIEAVMSDKQAEESILELNIKIRAQQILSKSGLAEDYKIHTKGSKLDNEAIKNLTLNDIFKLNLERQ